MAVVILVIVAAIAVKGSSEAPSDGAAAEPAAGASPEAETTAPEPPPEPVGMSDEEVAGFVPELPAAQPGVTNSVALTMPDGRERRYLYSTPPSHNPAEPVPVLLAMGGWTDTPENFLDYSGFSTSAAAEEAVVVYPAGVNDAWAGAPYSTTTAAEDISFLRAVVAQLETALPVDRERIYAVGMSNGGGMALELACHAPDFVAGIAAVSATFYEGVDRGCVPAPVATQIMHGTDDELLNYDGGILHDTPYLSVTEMVRTVAARNGCAEQSPESVPLGANADRLTWRGCAAATQHVRVNGGFHDWFLDPDTPDETWEFLSSQRAG